MKQIFTAGMLSTLLVSFGFAGSAQAPRSTVKEAQEKVQLGVEQEVANEEAAIVLLDEEFEEIEQEEVAEIALAMEE